MARYKKGQSGNPAGRPKGARNKATMAVEALLEGEAERLTRKAVDLALKGDTTALRLCMERVCPPRRDRPITLKLRKIGTLADVASAQAEVIAAVGRGEVTPSEADRLSVLFDRVGASMERSDLEARVAELEGRM